MRADATSTLIQSRRRRRTVAAVLARASIVAVVSVAVVAVALGLAFAGSAERLAGGVQIAGVDVGGLTRAKAQRLLEGRSARLARVPVAFTAGGERFELAPNQLGLRVDWATAVALAGREGDGFGPLRGFRRLQLRLFGGTEVAPSIRVWDNALDYELGLLGKAVDRPHRDAALVLRGLRPVVVPSAAGRRLDRRSAGRTIVASLASFSRKPVALPVRDDPPSVTAATLAPVAARVRTALSAPVRLVLDSGTRFALPPRRIATLLELPRNGTRGLRIGGPAADRYFARLARVVGRAPVDARFRVLAGNRVGVIPAKDGLALDVPATAAAVLAAALSPSARVAHVVVARKEAGRTTADANAMGITGLVASYETIYGGVANRIHNVQLVARLIDDHLIAPGATFSFNQTTGERSAAKGFLEAPVIINGELQTGLGGGVCQVSTTVFNAAYEAGLKITARTNHALYISHYPLGRDATVDYPDVDLRFVNDTKHWLLLRTFVGASSLTVALYGTPVHRKVVSEASPLVATGSPPVQRIKDPALRKGKTKVVASGSPPLATSVHRQVYDEHGTLLHDDVWRSSYRGEVRIVRVGTKKAKPAQPPGDGYAWAQLRGLGPLH